jgi:DNA-directed RNA polymerase subunit RPC12/RpoP
MLMLDPARLSLRGHRRMIKCPECESTVKFFKGTLAGRTFYRCGTCGTDYTKDIDDFQNKDGDIDA